MKDNRDYTREYAGIDAQRANKKKVKTFAVAFLSFTLLLGAVSFLMLWRHYGYDFGNIAGTSATQSTQTESQAQTAPVLSGSCSVLYVHSSDSGEVLRSACVVRVVLDEGRISVVPLDIGGTGGYKSAFESGGIASLEAVLASKNVQYDRYLVATDSGVVNVLKYLGDLPFTITEAVEYRTEDFFVDLPEGEQLLTPESAVKLVKYYNIVDDSDESAKNCALLLVTAINSFYNEDTAEESEEMYSTIINLVQSNISAVDFADARSDFEAFAVSDTRMLAYIEGSSSRR